MREKKVSVDEINRNREQDLSSPSASLDSHTLSNPPSALPALRSAQRAAKSVAAPLPGRVCGAAFAVATAIDRRLGNCSPPGQQGQLALVGQSRSLGRLEQGSEIVVVASCC